MNAFVGSLPSPWTPRHRSLKEAHVRNTISTRKRVLACSLTSAELYVPTIPTRRVNVFDSKSDVPAFQSNKRSAAAGVVIVPGYGSSSSEYIELQKSLVDCLGPEAVVVTANVDLLTWARTLGGRPVTPVLERIDEAVEDVRKRCRGNITVVGHSAGGWIARIWLSTTANYCGRIWQGADRVDRLLCLGTPQQSCEPVTLKNMTFVNQYAPACSEAPKVSYVCIGGSGLSIGEAEAADKLWRVKFWETAKWFGRLSYRLTDSSVGESACTGDGIVPVTVAFLEGAENVLLEKVWHSPSSPGPWYGHPKAVAFWADYIL